MIIYRFACACGYETTESLWIPGFVMDAPADIDNQVEDGGRARASRPPPLHPMTRLAWEAMLRKPVVARERERIVRRKQQSVEEEQQWGMPVVVRRESEERAGPGTRPAGNAPKAAPDRDPLLISVWELGHCTRCQTLDSYLQVTDPKTRGVLNPSLCRICGSEVKILSLDDVKCPRCGEHIEAQQIAME